MASDVRISDIHSTDECGKKTFLPNTSWEEVKKQRQLEEARKSGLIPAEKDEEGKDINPHIPQYIAKAPWYLRLDDKPTLKHQRTDTESFKSTVQNWYKRGIVKAPVTKFREGACYNCGAMTHSAKDCTERPRKVGSRWTGKEFCPDELIVKDSSELQLDFDGKRDRYGGYDSRAYNAVIRDYELIDSERKKRHAQKLKEGDVDRSKKKSQTSEKASEFSSDSSASCSSSDDESLEKNAEDDVKAKDFETSAPIGMKDDRTRTTTMNLRIREDTAKYLFNLDINSAFYDPKTRSMRDNPLKHLKETEQNIYRGDNYKRFTGEALAVNQMELFAWEAHQHNLNVHTQAQPTQLEYLHREVKKKQQDMISKQKTQLLEKYGGSEHIAENKLYEQTEQYHEFDLAEGCVKVYTKQNETKSQYDEDALFGDHSEIWGSWYDRSKFLWGYSCCKQLTRSNPECIPFA